MKRILPILLLILGVLVPAQGASKRVLRDAEAKAAFILNFARFTQWPEGALPASKKSPMVIAVTSEGPLADELKKASRRFSIDGRPVSIVPARGNEGSPKCQVFVITETEEPTFRRFVKGQGGRNVLLVGEQEDSIRWGAVVAFKPLETKLQFVINLKAAREHKVILSSQLLKLAAAVTE